MLPGTRNLGRYREIASVLARHGFGWLIGELGLGDLVPFSQRLGRAEKRESRTQPVRLRLAFEELGTAFIKVGQLLSTRPDLLPPEYIAELSKLQDATPPAPYAQVAVVLEAELGAPPEKIFATFDDKPLASASIGQVHTARLHSGEEVVVKVQRPGVDAAVERDLDVLTELAGLVESHTRFGSDYDVVGLADEFAFTLRSELMYGREGQNADRFREAFSEEPSSYVPRVYWDCTTDRVIVQERLRGIKVDNLAALESAGVDRKKLAADTVRLTLEQMFLHGFFHADPHPGNFFVLEDSSIGMMDFGMIGYLDDPLQGSLSRLFMALFKGDTEQMMDELLAMGVSRTQVNRVALKRDLDHMIILYKNSSAKELEAANIFNEMTGLARRHHLGLPSDLLLMAKVMAMSEGLGTRLDPDFQFVPFATPYFKRFWLAKRSPEKMKEKMAEGVAEMAELGITLPRHLRRFMTQAERGELGARVELSDMDRFLSVIQAMVNRLAVSILVGSLIVGLSLFLHMFAPESSSDYAGWFFGISFIGAVFFGIWLLFGLLRSGRR